MNERQKKAIEYLKENKKISRSEYVELTECSERTALRDLKELMDENIVVRRGSGRGTYYELS